MANIINTRIVLRNDDLSNWVESTKELLKGEVALAKRDDGTYDLRIGDGTNLWKDLSNSFALSADQVIGLTDSIASLSTSFYEVANKTELTGNYNNGDIAIVKTAIGDGTGKYSFTAYRYDSSLTADDKWCALDGNYNASNVYFDEDLTYTTGIGVIPAPTGSGTLDTAGKSVEDLFKQILAKESTSITTDTAWDVSFTVGNIAGAEAGTTLTATPTFTLKATDAPNWSSYGGMDSNGNKVESNVTGSEISGYIIDENSVEIKSGVKSAADTLTTHVLPLSVWGESPKYTDAAQTKTLTAYWDATASTTKPVTNLGNLILTNSVSNIKTTGGFSTENFENAKGGFAADLDNQLTCNVTVPAGTRYMFFNSSTTVKAKTSAEIRKFTNKTAKGAKTDYKVTIVEGANQVIFAVPSDYKVTKVLDVNAFGTDVFSSFKDTTVKIEGANGYTAIDYTVYEMLPSASLGANTFKVTITKV